MRIDVDQVLVDFDGAPLPEPQRGEVRPAEGWPPLTVKGVCWRALTTAQVRTAAGEDALLKRYELAQRIYHGGEIDIDAKEAVLVKQCVAAMYLPLVYGRIHEVLEHGRQTAPHTTKEP